MKETIAAALKNEKWKSVAKTLSSSIKGQISRNLFEIDAQAKAGDTVIVLGKVLSKGELTKKIRIVALSISEKAKEKLKESKSEVVSILEEITKNPTAQGLRFPQGVDEERGRSSKRKSERRNK